MDREAGTTSGIGNDDSRLFDCDAGPIGRNHISSPDSASAEADLLNRFIHLEGTAPAVPCTFSQNIGLRATSSVPGGVFAKSTKCSTWNILSLPYCTYMNRD